MKLRMEKPVYGGECLARIPEGESAGKAVFVPFALPGELVEATVRARRPGYIRAELGLLLESADFRTAPGCPYYSRCGGCHYQHATYPAQLAMKQAILLETLARASVELSIEPQLVSAEPWGYRNRIRLHISQDRLAYRAEGSHQAVAVDHCPIAAPLLQQAIALSTGVLQEAADLREPLTGIEFFCDAEATALLVTLFVQETRSAKSLTGRFAEALHARLPELRGVRCLQPSRRVPEVVAPLASWRETSLDYLVHQRSYRVTAGAFFQVNRFLVPSMVEMVCNGRSGALAWDLYAGVGLFAKALAAQFDRVIAVESSPLSKPDLRHNLQGCSGEAVAMDAEVFLSRQKGPKPDLAVVDPPRAGLGKDACRLLAAAQPKQIVYVSCDPSTLARDLRTLQPFGYRPVALTLIDLFPQTFHLETVATLERA